MFPNERAFVQFCSPTFIQTVIFLPKTLILNIASYPGSSPPLSVAFEFNGSSVVVPISGVTNQSCMSTALLLHLYAAPFPSSMNTVLHVDSHRILELLIFDIPLALVA